MNFNFIKKVTTLAILGAGVCFVSCQKPENNGNKDDDKTPATENIAITGTVTDTYEEPLEGVSVSVFASATEKTAVATTTSESDGTFSLTVDKAKAGYVSFEKDGYSVVGITITESSIKNGVVQMFPELEFANAKITGRVLDAFNDNAPLQGASVSNGATTVTTGADGTYAFEKLTIDSYTLTFTASGYTSATKQVTIADFNADGVAEVQDVVLGGDEILPGYHYGDIEVPGLTAYDLKSAPKWFINEYRGGFGLGGNGSGDDNDYGNATMSLMSGQFSAWMGLYEMQNEGCTLQIVDGNVEDSGRKANLKQFDSYTYGSKLITEDNKILSIYWRTHQGSSDNQVPWGVMVVDLGAADPKAELVGEIQYGADTDWHTTTFDLGKYVGKEVIVAIGDFRREDDKCWYQFVLTHVSFGPVAVDGHKALGLYGTPISGLEGWRMNLEEVKSMMPNPRTSFNGSKGDLVWEANPCFGVWRGTGHIASEWGLQYVNQTCTPDCGEGFMLQTHSSSGDIAALDSKKPCSYFYSKFSIDDNHDQMTFYTRNFSSDMYTYFKVTVIEEDGTVTFLDPKSNTAAKAEKSEDGCWKFIHENGWSGDLNSCAAFVYDLSSFKGKDVVITIGIHKNTGGEQKLVFCGVNFE